MSQCTVPCTVLFTANKEKTLRLAGEFQNSWLYGPAIHETLWPKYGKEFSFFAEFFGGNDWEGLESAVLSSDNFDDKMVYLSMSCGFFHIKDKEKVGNAIISFAEGNKFTDADVRDRMIEVGTAIKSIEDEDAELFGLCIDTTNNYVAKAFSTGRETFLAHAEEEFPNESEEFYNEYYKEMKKEFKGRKMYKDDKDYRPLRVVHISEKNKVKFEDLSTYYIRRQKIKKVKFKTNN